MVDLGTLVSSIPLLKPFLRFLKRTSQSINGWWRWDKSARDYELQCLSGTAYAYVRKETVKSDEPPHWLCATCFGNRRKTILQYSHFDGWSVWRCHICGMECRVAQDRWPDGKPRN